MAGKFEFNQIQEQLGDLIIGGASTNADIIFCIDATESMSPIINEVKNMALTFQETLKKALSKEHKELNQLRIKVIVFRDYYCDGPYAMEESDFFYLPEEKEAFSDFVNKIEAKGGGDAPENALEAIALAMKSDWVQEGTSLRHIVVLFTDAPAHPLEKAKGLNIPDYPSVMLGSYQEMKEAWNVSGQGSCMDEENPFKMNKKARRMVIFAPDAEPWSDMIVDFEQSFMKPILSDKGGSEIDESVIITLLGKSLT